MPLFAQEISQSIWTTWIQAGFAGLCLVLLVILSWFISKWMSERKENQLTLVDVINRSHDAVNNNTRAMEAICEQVRQNNVTTVAMRDELYRRPCIAKPHQS